MVPTGNYGFNVFDFVLMLKTPEFPLICRRLVRRRPSFEKFLVNPKTEATFPTGNNWGNEQINGMSSGIGIEVWVDPQSQEQIQSIKLEVEGKLSATLPPDAERGVWGMSPSGRRREPRGSWSQSCWQSEQVHSPASGAAWHWQTGPAMWPPGYNTICWTSGPVCSLWCRTLTNTHTHIQSQTHRGVTGEELLQRCLAFNSVAAEKVLLKPVDWAALWVQLSPLSTMSLI